MTTIPLLPVLSRTSPTFKADLDAAFLTGFNSAINGFNTVAGEVEADAATAASGAATATTQVTLAAAQVALAAAQVALADAAALAARGAANYRGDYSAVVLYAVGQSVSYAGSTYAKKTTAPAGTTPVNGTNWLKLGDTFVGDTLTTSRALSAPDWLLCNGGVYLQASYAALFGVLGLLSVIKNAGSWTARTLPSSASWNSVTYGNGVFVAVASGTAAATSPDGITWTARTLPSSASWYSVTYGNGVFVAVAQGSAVAANTLNILPYNTATQFITPPDDSKIAGLTTYIKT